MVIKGVSIIFSNQYLIYIISIISIKQKLSELWVNADNLQDNRWIPYENLLFGNINWVSSVFASKYAKD